MEALNGPALDPTVALVLVAAGAVALFFYFWSAKNKNNNKNGVDRLEQARLHSDIDVATIASECESSGKPWKDPSFGHDSYPGNSIGQLELRDGERGTPLVLGKEGVSWQPPDKFGPTSRPMGVRGDGLPTWLYSDNDGDGVASAAESMEADDVRQGSVGDCYLLAALSAVVQHHPDLADDLIDETYEEYGIYGVSLWRRGRWRMTWVDSYFPCYRPSSRLHRGKYRLVFAGATDGKEIWPLVVEKAFAKVMGSYEAISGGQVAPALEMLTGGRGRSRRPASVRADWGVIKEQVKSDEYWVGAGSQHVRTDASDAAEQKKWLRGIVAGHAYSVLNVYEDGELRLLELRNPWARGEWTGDWGPGSRKWKSEEGRRAESVVGASRKRDGRFWMSWDDFVARFDTIDSCYMNFTDEDRARRTELKRQAEMIVADSPTRISEESDDAKDEATLSAEAKADAMMEWLLADEAKKKRKSQTGANGKKKRNKGKRK